MSFLHVLLDQSSSRLPIDTDCTVGRLDIHLHQLRVAFFIERGLGQPLEHAFSQFWVQHSPVVDMMPMYGKELPVPIHVWDRQPELHQGRFDLSNRPMDNKLPRRMGINPIRRNER